MPKIVKHFHLAFKGMETDEVYDVLMEQLISAVEKYDPTYKDKVKQVAGVINSELSKRKQVLLVDANRYLDFDGDRYFRLLDRLIIHTALNSTKTARTRIKPGNSST